MTEAPHGTVMGGKVYFEHVKEEVPMNPKKPDTAYSVDGHLLFAQNEDAARDECRRLYDHDPESITVWVDEDEEVTC